MSFRSLRTGILATLMALAVPWMVTYSLACPFCSAPSLTLTEQLTQADAVALVKWKGGKPAKDQDAGSTDYEVVEVVRQPMMGKLTKGQVISLVRHRPGKPEDQFLLLGTRGGAVIDWGSPMEVTETSYKYITAAPAPDVPAVERMKYFIKFLEHPDQIISNDAYGEFANTAYADITPIAPDMPRAKLREWLVNPETSPSRLGLYGLMLGLCGTPDDVPVLEKKILDSTEEFRLGIDGIMGGYLLLTGEDGLKKLEEHKLSNKKAPFSETYAAMQALRFMWQYGDNQIPADRLRASMRLLLDRPELADLVIADLARWKDWTVMPQLMKLYGAEEYDIPSIKRAIVRFMLAGAKDVPTSEPGQPAADLPAHARQAAEFLAELEKNDPKTVSEAKRFFFIK